MVGNVKHLSVYLREYAVTQCGCDNNDGKSSDIGTILPEEYVRDSFGSQNRHLLYKAKVFITDQGLTPSLTEQSTILYLIDWRLQEGGSLERVAQTQDPYSRRFESGCICRYIVFGTSPEFISTRGVCYP